VRSAGMRGEAPQPTYFQLPVDRYAACLTWLRLFLIRRAKRQDGQAPTIEYGELAREIAASGVLPDGFDLRADSLVLFHMLGDVSVHEHNQGRSLLSVLVVLAGTYEPGSGFPDARLRHCYRGMSRIDLTAEQLTAVIETWRVVDPHEEAVEPAGRCSRHTR